jgi:hypothetical protein
MFGKNHFKHNNHEHYSVVLEKAGWGVGGSLKIVNIKKL